MIISFICESFLFQISLIELDNLMFLLFSMPFFLNCIKHTYFIFVSKVSMSGFCTDFSQHLIVSINAHSCFLVCLMNFDQGFIFLGKLSRGLFFEDWVETMFIQRDLHCLLGTWEQHYQPGTVLNQKFHRRVFCTTEVVYNQMRWLHLDWFSSWALSLLHLSTGQACGRGRPIQLPPLSLICQGWHDKPQRLGGLNSGSSSLTVLEARSLISRHHRVVWWDRISSQAPH